MQRKDVAADRSSQIARIAWRVTFVVPLILATLLLTVKSAQAEPLPSPVTLDLEEVFEAEVEEVSELELEEACIEAEEALEAEGLAEVEMEEICEEEPEIGSKSGAGATECALRSADAHASAKNDRLKLTIGYTTTAPTNATFEVKLGNAKLASLHRQLGQSGVIRFTKQLAEQQTGKVTVRIKLPAGSAGCPSRRLVLFPR